MNEQHSLRKLVLARRTENSEWRNGPEDMTLRHTLTWRFLHCKHPLRDLLCGLRCFIFCRSVSKIGSLVACRDFHRPTVGLMSI